MSIALVPIEIIVMVRGQLPPLLNLHRMNKFENEIECMCLCMLSMGSELHNFSSSEEITLEQANELRSIGNDLDNIAVRLQSTLDLSSKKKLTCHYADWLQFRNR